jgi:branched-chain amino acid transport system permease protein
VIIGGAGTILGSFLGSAFIVLTPIVLNVTVGWLDASGLHVPASAGSNLEVIVFGVLIIFFLIVEPLGIARLWSIGKEKLRLWPFPH